MSARMKSKREQEEDKKKADEEAAAKVYEDFYNTFVDVPDQKSKVWVKAGTFDAGSKKEDTRDKGKLYKPTSRLEELRDKFSSAEKAAQHAAVHTDRPERPGRKKEKEKKKSNLELFKDELKMIQEERAERYRIKSMYHRGGGGSSSSSGGGGGGGSSSSSGGGSGSGGGSSSADGSKSNRFENQESKSSSSHTNEGSIADDSKSSGSYDSGDPTTTNLYLGNLSPKITEQRLMELFGRFGPLASIKIMWPRTDDERSRGRNCGFVAFMNRKDGERGLAYLNGKDIDGFEMKLGWGKAVPIPQHPIYIPPALLELTLPPPPSGLPFNAQPDRRDFEQIPPMGTPLPVEPEGIAVMNKILQRAVVKVVIPTERSLLHLIHRTIEFVVREGPMFEAMIMNKEIDNPDFRFLFNNQSPAHVYYRWKLFSILMGESQSRWSTKPFRMFKGGSIWKPPPLNPFLQGMPEELIKKDEEIDERNKKGSLSNAQRKRLESMIRAIIPEREKIAESMVWCIEHAEAAEEICQCLTEAMTNPDTSLPKKIARLYLVSDLLHNCCVKVTNASFFRKYLQPKLFEIVEGLHFSFESIESRIRAEQVKQRVMQCFRVWEDWAVYPHDFLIKLQNLFLGFVKNDTEEVEEGKPIEQEEPRLFPEDVDGIPMDDVDGFPLADVNGHVKDEANTPLLKSSAAISALQGYQDDDEEDEDIDGAPFDDDIDGIPIMDAHDMKAAPGFVPSKWESVSPNRIESQAMTLSKWDELEASKSAGDASGSDTTPIYNQPATPKNEGPIPVIKKLDGIDDEDIDGVPLVYEDYKRRLPSSDEEDTMSQSQENNSGSEDSRGDNEERRAKLRAVEIKVLQYQDELEKGIRPIKPGYSLQRQVQHYRHKLIRKINREEDGVSERRQRRRRSRSSSQEEKRHKRSRHRSRSRSPRKHRSRSPRRRRTHSRSPSRKHKKKNRH